MDLQADTVDVDTPCASLQAVAATIRALVQPKPLLSELKTLVTLLSHVEVIRGRFLEQLEEMLRLDELITTGQGNLILGDIDDIEPVPLTDEDHIHIAAILRRKSKMRRLYRNIVNGFSLLDVYEIWCSPNHARLDGLFDIYFPSIDSPERDKWLFHAGLTDVEWEELTDTAELHMDLIERYLKDLRRKRSPPNATPAFREKYPFPLDMSKLVQQTLSYVDEMEQAVERVEGLLASVDP